MNSFLILMVTSLHGAGLSSARVSQVIQDVRLLPSSAAARPAVVNDNVGAGTAVRTGIKSRAELTFQDLTITRLGENTIFSLKEGTRDLTLEHGSILLQVPSGAPAANIRTTAVTAAVSGGTAILGTGPPVKFMVLEGIGTFYPPGHPEDAVTLHGGEMASLGPDGHVIVQTFNVKLVLETSPLITQFPDLANLPLILEVQNQQQTDQSNPGASPPPSKDIIDTTSQNTTANPAVQPSPPSGTSGETGTPPTITTPDPYQITPGTVIQTDPSITTNGVTDFGTFYRGTALDGTPTEFLFGEAETSFDQFVFADPDKNLPVAAFKFQDLELTGDPTIVIPSGGTTNLALVSLGTITSGGPGGTLTFAGIDRLDFITQNGSINLGSDIAFSGIDHLTFYARGSESNLTLTCPISGGSDVTLYSGSSAQVNGDISVSDTFGALTGGDFLAGSGTITATNIDIVSLNNINMNLSQFPNPVDNTGSVTLSATNTLNLNLDRAGGFGWNSLDASATTINITGSNTFDFSNTSSMIFTAGVGGINAANINFVGSPSGGWSLTSGGSITVGSINSENATISAATSFTASGDITGTFIGSTLTAGTTVDVGGNLFVYTLTAGGNINVGNAFITLTLNAPSSVLNVQGNIEPFGGEGMLQYTYNVDSIVAPSGIDFNFNGTPDFVGKLTINSNTLTFDSETGIAFANFDGVNANEFGSGNPAEGGDGGTFIVNSAGNITANSGADITATTGLNTESGVFSGAGGSVTLHSTGGMVTVNDMILVSSDDSESFRQSASGGTIDLQSDLTSGTGITLGANGQLLSLLDFDAPGPGGSITLSTMGAGIVVNGTIEADRGTITIDQTDPAAITAPLITIDGATLIADTLNITGAGDINVGLDNPVTVDVGTLFLSAPGSIQFDYASTLNLTSFDAETGGASDASFNMNLSGDFNDAGDALFHINNDPGTISSDAVLSVSANNLAAGYLEA
ncbi:MAG TPA: FecR domain-containing protein, partial [Chthoniobacterales bacterium]|nr:FecR domain-containing protein [Chthoniobacterales bacterium]